MASNDIYKACARRVTEHHLACKSITDDIRAIREQVSGSSGPEKQNLEAMLEIRMQEKSDESRAGINAQIDLLNLVKDSDSTTVPGNILTELNRIFSGKGLDQLREQFEVDRDAAISGDGRLGRSNPNGISSFHILFSFHLLMICSFETTFSADEETDLFGSEKATR